MKAHSQADAAMKVSKPQQAPLFCTVPTIPAGGKSWNGTNGANCASGKGKVGTTCKITPEDNYHCTNPGRCSEDGNFEATAACQATPCDASASPSNGAVGNCTANLAWGSTCQPTCVCGYKVS